MSARGASAFRGIDEPFPKFARAWRYFELLTRPVKAHLDLLHVLVAETEMVADFVDQDVAHEVSERLLASHQWSNNGRR